MNITNHQATVLCQRVVDSLSLANWPALYAALQSGGLEEKATCRIATALETWLAEDMKSTPNLLVLREYRKIDFALIESSTISNGRLTVDTVIEVKSNYATQISEIQKRIPKARDQAADYLKRVGAQDAYVLYLVAAPCAGQMPLPPLDSGWRYWNSPCPATTMQKAIETIRNASVLGDASSGSDQLLYCALLNCPEHAVSTVP